MLVGGTTAGNAVRPDDAVAWGYKTTSSAVDNHWVMAVDGWEGLRNNGHVMSSRIMLSSVLGAKLVLQEGAWVHTI